ncbi:hypothetical protein HUG15_16985 [Salicibibacter cibarius]|uniref:Uncharacterized protein n=1 Tax=Salicibibacter cibarius TaxID=2743000 RepID=A0A7T7CCM7_9BACI|nr:hypothetical protein [Salicibibacter cibarius]QQK77103.1 hypothetical protein HUG15_16985 [Salicibibacter cibarius]
MIKVQNYKNEFSEGKIGNVMTRKKENDRILKKTKDYKDMEHEVKKLLETTTEVKTVVILMKEYDLSLLEARKIIDSVK